MRIIAGEFRGRRITAPKGETTRPTTDRVREAIFSAIASLAGPDLGGGAVLDAFAGSGALGLEALSRGCSSATFVDDDRSALATLKANIAALGVGDRARVVAGDVVGLAGRGGVPGAPFALLLLDPPYRLDPGQVTGLISALVAHELLEDGAIAVLEHGKGAAPAWPAGFEMATRKRYGTTEVGIAVYGGGAGSS